MLRLGIIGCGAIGGTLAGHLAKAGHVVHVVDPNVPHATKIARDGIKIIGHANLEQKVQSVSPTISEMKEQTGNGSELDYVLLVTRTSTLPSILPEAANLLFQNQKCFCIVAQNGIDTEEAVAEQIPRNRILRGVINFAGYKVSDGVIRMSTQHLAKSAVGAVNFKNASSSAAADKFVSALNQAGITSFNPKHELRRFEYEKAIKNAAVGPVCALTEMTLQQCLDNAGTYKIVKQLFNEGQAVARADSWHLDHTFFEESMDYFRKAIEDDRTNKPMMLLDIEAGVPTEVGVLNERIAELGEELGVPCESHASYAALIRAMEGKRVPL